MSNRTVLALSLLVLSLTACPKKPDAAADSGAAEASAPTAATSAPLETVDAATATSPLPGTPPPPQGGAGGAAKLGGVTFDAGGADAAVTTAGVDAGAVAGECCCEVTGQPLTSTGQSDCTKGKKGQCVKKERCAAAAVVVPTGQTCCCDVAGKKSILNQSDCTKGGAAKCVKLSECKK
jgi:hypothetical protein